jgi:hypothetical protein
VIVRSALSARAFGSRLARLACVSRRQLMYLHRIGSRNAPHYLARAHFTIGFAIAYRAGGVPYAAVEAVLSCRFPVSHCSCAKTRPPSFQSRKSALQRQCCRADPIASLRCLIEERSDLGGGKLGADSAAVRVRGLDKHEMRIRAVGQSTTPTSPPPKSRTSGCSHRMRPSISQGERKRTAPHLRMNKSRARSKLSWREQSETKSQVKL